MSRAKKVEAPAIPVEGEPNPDMVDPNAPVEDAAPAVSQGDALGLAAVSGALTDSAISDNPDAVVVPAYVFNTVEEYQAHLDVVTQKILEEHAPSPAFRVFASAGEMEAYEAEVAYSAVHSAAAWIGDRIAERVAAWRAEAARQDQLAAGDPTKKAYFNYFADDLERLLTELIP